MSQTRALVWGNNNESLLSTVSNQCLTRPEQIKFPYQILKLAASEKHISFITVSGDVYSYGSNTDGRLGIGAKDSFTCTYKNPVKVKLEGKAKQIKSGFSHTCVQLENNEIYSWGLGEYGGLGIGEFRSKYTPTKVLIPPTIRQMSCGAMHTSYVDFEGKMYMCGSNQYGQLGIKSPDKIGTPILIPFTFRVKQVACGVFYTLFLTQDGDVYGMGNNKYGQLGLGHKINEAKPTLIRELTNIVKVEAGYHSGALNSMCQLFLWGCGSFGQLLRPKKIILNCPLSNMQIRGFFGIVISESQNRMFIWGNNTHGELGNGGYISYKTPTEMIELSQYKIQKICCGVNFAVALIQDDPRKFTHYEQRLPERIQERILESRSVSKFGTRDYYRQSTEIKGAQNRERVPEDYVKTPEDLSKRPRNTPNYSRSPSPIRNLSRRQMQQIQASPQRREYDMQSSPLRHVRQNSAKKSVHFQKTQNYPRENDRTERIIPQGERLGGPTERDVGRSQRDVGRSQIDGGRLQRSVGRPQREVGRSYSSSQRNYEELFLNLSKDYEILAIKYKELQAQIEKREMRRSRQIRDVENQMYSQSQSAKQVHLINAALKEQTYNLEKLLITAQEELNIGREELSIALQKITQLEKQVEYLSLREVELLRNKSASSPSRSPIRMIDSQHNEELMKIVTEKEDKIRNLEDDNTLINQMLEEEKYKNQILQTQAQRVPILQNQNSVLKDQNSFLQEQNSALQNQNSVLKDQNSFLQEQNSVLQNQNSDLQDQNSILKSELQAEKIFASEIEAKFKALSLQQSENAKQKAIKSSPKKNPMQQVDAKLIEHFKALLLEKQNTIIKTSVQRGSFKDQLEQQKLYCSQVQGKYKAVMENIDAAQVQIMSLRQQLLRSEERIASLESEVKKMVPLKDYESMHKQLVQKIGKAKQLQENLNKSETNLKNQKQAVSALQQQRLNLYTMIEEMKNVQHENKILYERKLQEENDKTQTLKEKVKELQAQVNYEKDYSKKLEEKSLQVEKLREEACQQIIKVTEALEKERKRKKELEREIESFKTTENQLKITREQLQKQRKLNEDYKDRVLKEYKKKDQLIKEMQRELEQKQGQISQMNQRREGDLNRSKQELRKSLQKMDKQKGQVRRLIKQGGEKSEQIENLKEEIQKLQRKLKHTREEMEKEVSERQELVEEVGSSKREQTRVGLQKQQVQKRVLQLQKQISQRESALKRQRGKNVDIQEELSQFKQRFQSLKKQNSYIRSQLEQANTAVQEANRISQQLSNANKEFSENQDNLNKKIQQLEARIYQVEDQNRSYTPRYDALIQRNKQLDDRNRQLSDMVNKAIEIQAQSYKDSILKEVEASTNQIIDEVEDEKTYKQRFNRKPPVSEEDLSPHYQNEQNSYSQPPQLASRVNEQAYTKYMNEKIDSHRKRVSDSAQKLAGILDLDSGVGSAYTRRNSSINRRANDEHYEKINSHMDSLKSQKDVFMDKINSFASKMKLL